MKIMLATAIAFSADKHKGQFDRGGMPYILHPLRVMYYLKTDDMELMCIAVLHDVVEDCGVTYADLRTIGMSERVIAGVKGMTKVPGETEDEAFVRLTSNRDTILVKKEDLRHNMDARRLKEISPKASARMDKYCKLYWALKDLA
jgi:(p)ppGpp synthase/HD superfamily hydrolase